MDTKGAGMAKAPAFSFYVRDWTADCNGLSVAAKGAWIQMLCQLHLSDKYGELTKTLDAWARICGCSTDELDPLLAELQHEGVCDMSHDVTNSHPKVTVVSRRMAAARKERESARLRKAAQRERAAGPENVTTPFASAVSAVASAPSQQDDAVTEKPPAKKPTDREQQGEEVVKDYIRAIDRPDDHCTKRAVNNVVKLLKAERSVDELKEATGNYLKSCEAMDRAPAYRKSVANFFGRDAEYEAYLPDVWKPPREHHPSDPASDRANALYDQRNIQ